MKQLRKTCRTGVINHRCRAQSGFTLIEVLLVIVIILMLAGALVVFVLPQQEGAEKNTTKLLLQNVETALDTYRLNMGRYPTTEQGLNALVTKPTFENERQGDKWNGPYLKPGTKLEDAWGNVIRYELADVSTDDTTSKSSARYKLYSIGPDGQPDTADDIKSREENADGTNGEGVPKSD
jgi:general secretion pathway protein G